MGEASDHCETTLSHERTWRTTVACLGPVGRFPKAPGTAGSLVAIPMAAYLLYALPLWALALTCLLLMLFAVRCCGKPSKRWDYATQDAWCLMNGWPSLAVISGCCGSIQHGKRLSKTLIGVGPYPPSNFTWRSFACSAYSISGSHGLSVPRSAGLEGGGGHG